MFVSLLSMRYACAQQLATWSHGFRLKFWVKIRRSSFLIDTIILTAMNIVTSDDPSLYEEDFLAVLKSAVPSSPERGPWLSILQRRSRSLASTFYPGLPKSEWVLVHSPTTRCPNQCSGTGALQRRWQKECGC
ncbi:hypothetical protein BDN70DRAFT_371189 [Pholiota conissans]|uniref:Uncharacterized protein n=1 Tax=Pholiota conissans TaxID=109636 RepID=A0A9P5ZDI4_9AGAR|nr:hypothetical protein BDN70DRAFT_371189 [Pholiota conissans]